LNGVIFDIIGLTGSALFIGAFAYANVAKELNKLLFNALNLVGAILLLISLWVNFNLAAFVLETAWAIIAVAGLVAALKARKPSPLKGRGLGEGEAFNPLSTPASR
jgi:hypothetical protein